MEQHAHRENTHRDKLRDIQTRFMRDSEIDIDQWSRLDRLKRIHEGLVFLSMFVVGCLLMMAAGLASGLAMYLFAFAGVLFMGVAYNSLGLFIHEGLHGGLSKNKAKNRRVTFLLGIPLLISGTAYRVTHTYHHIELGQARDYGTYRQHTHESALVWLSYYLQLIAGSFIYIAFIPFLGYRHASRKIKRQIVFEYVLIAVLLTLAIVLLPNFVLVQYWLLPMLVMNLLTNIRGLASHALGDTSDPLLSSRTIKAPAFLSWLLLYENYHLAHHLFPKVPSYHLKAVHDHIWPQVSHACWNQSYAAFLIDFVKASVRDDLKPLGYIEPARDHFK